MQNQGLRYSKLEVGLRNETGNGWTLLKAAITNRSLNLPYHVLPKFLAHLKPLVESVKYLLLFSLILTVRNLQHRTYLTTYLKQLYCFQFDLIDHIFDLLLNNLMNYLFPETIGAKFLGLPCLYLILMYLIFQIQAIILRVSEI